MTAYLEHANITVADAEATAKLLEHLFGWHIRWQGTSIYGGHSMHVGSDTSYLALYTPADTDARKGNENSYTHKAGLNHLAFVVDDLDAVHRKVAEIGYTINDPEPYDPGRRFYFVEENGLEIEVVSYA